MNVQEILARSAPTAGPPPDADPSELVRRLMGPRASEVLPFPRNGADGKPAFHYRMTILSQRELDQARVSAERYARERLKIDAKLSDEQVNQVRREAWSEIYEDAKAVELLCLAMREPEGAEGKYRPLFTSGNRVRELLTVDEIALLFTTYTSLQEKYGPLWRLLNDDELDAWLKITEDGAAADPFCALSHAALVQLTSSLAARLARSKTGDSSLGSESSEPQTSSLETGKE